MPDDTDDETGPKAKGPKGEKRREQVLIGAAVAGVVLTALLLRKSSSGNAGQAIPVAAPVGNTGGTSGGVSSADFASLAQQERADFASIANQVYGLTGKVTGLEAAMGVGATGSPTSSPTSISQSPHQYTLQDVNDLFAQRGYSSVPADVGETGGQRADRILRQLNSGGRTPADVTAHIPMAV